MRIPALLYGEYKDVQRRCRTAMRAFLKGQSYIKILTADGFLDTATTPGLLVLEGSQTMFAGAHFHVFVPPALLVGPKPMIADIENAPLVSRMFEDSLEYPWSVLSLLSNVGTTFLFWGTHEEDRYQQFVPHVVRQWDTFIHEGARYSYGVPGAGHDLWDVPLSLWRGLVVLGASQPRLQALVRPWPQGGLREVLQNLPLDIAWPAAAVTADLDACDVTDSPQPATRRVDTDASSTPNYIEASERMHAAMQADDPRAVQRLIEAGEPADAFDFELLTTPLLWATQRGHQDLVDYLLHQLGDIEDRGPDGDSPLMIAAYYGYIDIVRLLLEHGANVRYVTSDGRNALSAATIGGHAHVVALLQSALATADN